MYQCIYEPDTDTFSAPQIRHGDKISEAANVADHSYLHETNELMRQLPELSGSVYMVTLINQSINYFVGQPNLSVFYTDVPRIAKADDRLMSVISEPW